jgi:hypothetical protein
MKINTKIKQIKPESEYIIKLQYIRITGHVKLKLMMGDIMDYKMDPEEVSIYEDFSEEDIFNSINDGGFGGCDILSAKIVIYGVYCKDGELKTLTYIPIKKADVDMINRKITYKKV